MCMHVSVCVCSVLSLCGPMGYSSIHSIPGIHQARILEWAAVSYSRGSSWLRDWTHVSCVSCIDRQILYCWVIRKTHSKGKELFNTASACRGDPLLPSSSTFHTVCVMKLHTEAGVLLAGEGWLCIEFHCCWFWRLCLPWRYWAKRND